MENKKLQYYSTNAFRFDIWQGAGNQYKGVSDCVKTILREEGSSALWKVNSFLYTHLVGVMMFLMFVQTC